jgi:glutathione peroxidase
MLKIALVAVLILITGGIAAAYRLGFIFNPSPSAPPAEKSMYEFTLKDIDGKDVKLDAYKGKAVMIVNTASKMRFDAAIRRLAENLRQIQRSRFRSFGFSSQQFMGQEPGTEKDIKEFCALNYKVSFPMFSKISVKGADQHPFYTFLTNKESNPGIRWRYYLEL